MRVGGFGARGDFCEPSGGEGGTASGATGTVPKSMTFSMETSLRPRTNLALSNVEVLAGCQRDATRAKGQFRRRVGDDFVASNPALHAAHELTELSTGSYQSPRSIDDAARVLHGSRGATPSQFLLPQ